MVYGIYEVMQDLHHQQYACSLFSAVSPNFSFIWALKGPQNLQKQPYLIYIHIYICVYAYMSISPLKGAL